MDVTAIIKDSLRYPLSDWKKILILGIIIVISDLLSVFQSLGVTNKDLIPFLVVVGFLIGLLVNGYLFRILRSSLDGHNELPKFNKWISMFYDGFKVFTTFIAYLIVPPVVILFLLISLMGIDFTFFTPIWGTLGINPLYLVTSEIFPGIVNFLAISYDIFAELSLLVLLFVFTITPIFLMAIANMAYEGEFSAAFRLHEILDEIGCIGWGNLIKWYLATGILFLILFIIGNIIGYLFDFLNPILVSVSLLLTLIPYSYMYYARAVALFYMPD
ncbi:DUF4013 domain-containing protein [Methanobacterium aggregans]|uniref:DUF4013 domain-containing protein n=1 Tax=Methanobacterium aggregans TaxID=1615586 RepID=UPI001AE49ED3|nr:DUF4013 domain-containing protein [Methanobacterium aggregans]MBP2046055.1 hypothetical protein [Methanobacterium aggregans]